jgi:small subunit ribosomal protein S20
MRERAVASEKIAVDLASRRPERSSTRASIGRAPSGTMPRPANCGPFHAMPNIRQQKKRVRTAGKQRLENLHYRSTAKTLAKRLETAVKDGDKDRAAAEHRELVRWLDRAAARGALHRNTAARRKAQAARLFSSDR